MAKRLARDGNTLVLLGRNYRKIQQVVETLGERALALSCDISDPNAVDEVFVEIARRYGKIDVLINNAGVYEPVHIRDATNTQISEALNINLAGPIYCSRAAIPLLERGGHIINIGSVTVMTQIAMLALYQTAKAGLERFSKTLQQELAEDGIRVTLVRAGAMYDETSKLSVSPEVAQRFSEENSKLRHPSHRPPTSRFDSVAEPIPMLIALPADMNIPEVMLDARHP